MRLALVCESGRWRARLLLRGQWGVRAPSSQLQVMHGCWLLVAGCSKAPGCCLQPPGWTALIVHTPALNRACWTRQRSPAPLNRRSSCQKRNVPELRPAAAVEAAAASVASAAATSTCSSSSVDAVSIVSAVKMVAAACMGTRRVSKMSIL